MSKSSDHRVLLLSGTAPGSSGVGQLFLRDLISTLSTDEIVFAIVSSKNNEADRAAFSDVPRIDLVERKLNHKKPAWMPQAVSVIRRHLEFRRHCRSDRDNVAKICEFAQARGVHKVWAVLDSPTMYRLAPMVAQSLGKPLVSTVWDPPEGVGLQFGLDRFSRRTARRHFDHAMRASECCSVISERMDRDYKQLYQTRTVVLRHGIAKQHTASQGPPDDSEFRLGFCGSLYAMLEWKALLDGLDQLKWKVANRPIRVIVAGGHVPFLSAKSPANLEFLGWRDMHEVVHRMSECHACYFPYWFAPGFAESVRYCFATKLTTYLTAGTPVLYHGPEDAAVVDFFREYPVAETCHSTDSSDVAATIERMADGGSQKQMRSAINRAIDQELNLDVFHRRFREMLGPEFIPDQERIPGAAPNRSPVESA